jgi:hypothetical protein
VGLGVFEQVAAVLAVCVAAAGIATVLRQPIVVGLTLDLRILRRLGTVAVAAGLGQVTFTAGVGYTLASTRYRDAVASRLATLRGFVPCASPSS